MNYVNLILGTIIFNDDEAIVKEIVGIIKCPDRDYVEFTGENLLNAFVDSYLIPEYFSGKITYECEKHLSINEQLNQNDKCVLIGYQVIDIDDGEPHPDMDTSFTLYCQSDAKKIIENGDEDEKGRWSIIPIYYGDIENPEYTFVGDPRA